MSEDTRTVHRICPLCEATCGIVVTVRDREVVDLRGDKLDPFSRGYICPKAHGLKGLQEDPDRLTRPLRRRGKDLTVRQVVSEQRSPREGHVKAVRRHSI